MTTLLKVVDDDLSTVRLDLNGASAPGFELKTGVTFVPTRNPNTLSQGVGVSEGEPEEGAAEMRFRLKAMGSSVDSLYTVVRSLQSELEAGRVIKWQPNGKSTADYLDVLASPYPSIFAGVWPEFFALDRYIQALDIVLWVQPHARAAPSTLATSEPLTNAVGDSYVIVTNPGSVESPARLEVVVPDASAEVVQVRVGRKSGTQSDLEEFATLYSFEIEGATLYGNTASASESLAGGGSVAETTYAAGGYFLRRWRKVITPVSPTALAGSYKAYVTVSMIGGAPQTLMLKHGMRDTEPLDFSNDEVLLDAEEADTEPFVTVDLGRVRFDENATSLVLEGWSKGADTNDYIQWDTFTLVPADEFFTTVAVPGFRGAQPSKDEYLGSDLITPTSPAATYSAGTDDETSKVLNANNEACGTSPNAGTAYPAGRHVFQAFVTLKDQVDASTAIAELRIRNVTDGNFTQERDFRTKAHRRETAIEKKVAWTAVAGKLYQAQVVQDIAAATGRKVIVNKLKHYFVPTVANDDSIVLDGAKPEQSGVYSDDVKVSAITGDPHLTLAPGPNLLIVLAHDWSGLTWQDDVDEREPLAKVVKDRNFEATVTVDPSHPL